VKLTEKMETTNQVEAVARTCRH